MTAAEEDVREERPAEARPPRPPKRDVHGWLILDKPVGMTSTHAVAQVKRIFSARKAGHAGTLDPLASGCLPIALGEATKTVPFVMDGRKAYRFTAAWGVETDTDDADGTAAAQSDSRPTESEILALLPSFTGAIQQVPPRYSALKIDGERAYDLARDGIVVEMQPRPVEIDALRLVAASTDSAVFEAECGKGTYVRALARDMGRALGCLGHVTALRRTRVGPFGEEHTATLDQLRETAESGVREDLLAVLAPVGAGLDALPCLTIASGDADRLRRGQSVLLRGRDAPVVTGIVAVQTAGGLVALGDVDQGMLHPRRIFDLSERPAGPRRRR
jgi:tRNA pseudouridine55 synthase